MFIYILNLLNDGSKNRSNSYEHSAVEIINDTKYITQLAGINKSYDHTQVCKKITDVFQLLNKYELTIKKKLEISNKLIKNKDNEWIIKYIYSNFHMKGESKPNLNSALIKIIEVAGKENYYIEKKQLALWTNNLEKMKDYYVKYFNGKAGEKRINRRHGLASYFISFESGVKIKIMSKKDSDFRENKKLIKEYGHIAIPVGSVEKVFLLTEEIRRAGYEVANGSTIYNDECYESSVLDPEGNLIQITI